ncbi:hypothetical protein QWY75_09590 [Pontixanthobacter aestiaquae]|uniref:hypothetical protein n=1 Tax=Pontixanthobacter aestiaquae TaxID=1509367 RepID=UPI001F42DF71|nr:hypothetical protein [Pontixanthobacter aestiaquae]MDN3646448.1 hypothetical protein [Pontixanthobacter aestiaquae]
MSDMIYTDALKLKKLIREAEALSDEAMLACSKLKQAMLKARQNPEVPVDTGQRAILRLTQAEQQAMSMSTSLLRVHDELSKVARVHAGLDGDIPTDIPTVATLESATEEIVETT